jgi:hypothetical protein
MKQISSLDKSSDNTRGIFNYISPNIVESKRVANRSATNDELYVSVEMNVRSMRDQPEFLNISKSLEDYSIGFARSPSKVTDFLDHDEVVKVYHTEMKNFARAITGCDFAVALPHLLRDEGVTDDKSSVEDLRRHTKSVRAHHVVHNDYSQGFQEYLKGLNSKQMRNFFIQKQGAEFEELRARILKSQKLVVLNIWRSLLDEPLQHCPLGMCSRNSISTDDLIEVPLLEYGGVSLPQDQRFGVLLSSPNHQHAWHYVPKLTKEECLVFKTYDSAMSPFLPPLHSAFLDPQTPENAPKRRSVEIRIACFWDENTTVASSSKL